MQVELGEGDVIIYAGDESIVLDIKEIAGLHHMLSNLKKDLEPLGKWTDEKGHLLIS